MIKKILLVLSLVATQSVIAMEENLNDQLIEAVRDNKYEQVARLLKEGVNPNGELSQLCGVFPLLCGVGVCPLAVAAIKGHVKVAELLLENGADIEPSEDEDWKDLWFNSSPLQLACEKGHTDMAKLLIRRGANVNLANKVKHTPLHNAVGKGHLEIVILLLGADAAVDPKEKLRRTYHSWSMGLYEFSSTANSWGSPLCSAINIDRTDIVELLTKYGADVHVKDGETELLAIAYANGNSEIINLLKKAGCELTKIKPVALIKPSQDGNRRAVRLLIQTGIALEGKDIRYQATPLNWAANNGHKEVCEMLLEAGADPHAQNKDGLSPLDCAGKQVNLIIVAILKRSKIELPSLEDRVNQLKDCERLAEYFVIIDLVRYSQGNPVSLKGLCLQKVRKLIKKGQINVSAVPNLEKFGFEHVIVSADQGTEKKESVNNDNSK